MNDYTGERSLISAGTVTNVLCLHVNLTTTTEHIQERSLTSVTLASAASEIEQLLNTMKEDTLESNPLSVSIVESVSLNQQISEHMKKHTVVKDLINASGVARPFQEKPIFRSTTELTQERHPSNVTSVKSTLGIHKTLGTMKEHTTIKGVLKARQRIFATFSKHVVAQTWPVTVLWKRNKTQTVLKHIAVGFV